MAAVLALSLCASPLPAVMAAEGGISAAASGTGTEAGTFGDSSGESASSAAAGDTTGESASSETSGDAASDGNALGGWKEQLTAALSALPQEQAEEVLNFLKEKAADGGLRTEQDIEAALSESEEKFQFRIDESQKEQILAGIEALHGMGLSAEQVIDQATQMYEKYGADAVNHIGEAAAGAIGSSVKEGFFSLVQAFFASVQESIKGFIAGIFENL